MHIFCLTAEVIRLCGVGEVHLGMICLEIAVKSITGKWRLGKRRKGRGGKQVGEGERLLNSVPAEPAGLV